jgi:hypothetical protein
VCGCVCVCVCCGGCLDVGMCEGWEGMGGWEERLGMRGLPFGGGGMRAGE